jgi:hypothetical protein
MHIIYELGVKAMTVLRHYFISDDLDDLEALEEQLEEAGIDTPQIHVLSLDDQSVESHVHLHNVNSFMKRDIVRSSIIGAAIGLVLSVSILLLSSWLGWTQTKAGWIPVIFLAVIALGFCTWEGGLFGIQMPNKKFLQFEEVLNAGRHVFFVDLAADQEEVLANLIPSHPSLQLAGTDKGMPRWISKGQKSIPNLLKETLP